MTDAWYFNFAAAHGQKTRPTAHLVSYFKGTTELMPGNHSKTTQKTSARPQAQPHMIDIPKPKSTVSGLSCDK